MKKIILILFIIVALASVVCAEGIDTNTVLMLHMDDAGLTDSSDSSHTVIKNGDAALNTGTYKFSPGSAYFDGTGDYLSISDSGDWKFSTGDFSIDLWIYITNLGVHNRVLGYTSSSAYLGGWNIQIESGGTFFIRLASETLKANNVITGNTWHHIAAVRESGALTLYVDGVSKSTANLASGMDGGAGYELQIADITFNDMPFHGYIDELRISKGIARWTENFTPPTAPYSAAPPAPFTCGDTVNYEGQSYNTVLIGEQCWFAENLNVGTKVTGVTTQTNNVLIEKYCYNDLDANCVTDGGLYQWNEAMQYLTTAGTQGICPDGWHFPTDAEWKTLEMELGMTQVQVDIIGWRGTDEGDKLKKAGLCQGRTPCGTSSFECLLAGYRRTNGLFSFRNAGAFLWSSTGALRRGLDLGVAKVGRHVLDKASGFSVRCLQNPPDTTPTSSNFTSEETTNFSAETDLENVIGMTLAVPDKGKIEFGEDYEMNCKNQDYDTNIVIEDGFISVDTAALDSSFNTSATITLEGVTCPVETITYQEGTFTSKDDIITGGSNCELDGVCSNIHCSGSNLTFDVAHFTGFAAGSNANLTIEAEAGVKYPLEDIEFTAEYINSTDGTPISGECNITFDDDWGTAYTMDFDSIDYNYTKAFATAALHDYNVTCSNASFVTLEANDSKLVSSVDIPEFSVLTLGLGLIAVLAGLFIIRRKR